MFKHYSICFSNLIFYGSSAFSVLSKKDKISADYFPSSPPSSDTQLSTFQLPCLSVCLSPCMSAHKGTTCLFWDDILDWYHVWLPYNTFTHDNLYFIRFFYENVRENLLHELFDNSLNPGQRYRMSKSDSRTGFYKYQYLTRGRGVEYQEQEQGTWVSVTD